MTRDPSLFRPFTFDDSNAFRWSVARKSPTSKVIVATVEKDAPYKTRALEIPPTFDDKETRAFIEASVAIPQRSMRAAPSSKPGNTPPGPSLPTKPSPGSGGAGWLVIIVIGLLALSKKGRR